MIDLNKLSYSQCESEYDINRLKGNHIFNYINQFKHSYIIIPISVYNILENCDNFIETKEEKTKEEGIIMVGIFGNFICYLDIYLPSDTIIVKHDKKKNRDLKIDYILNDSEIETDEIIEIIH